MGKLSSLRKLLVYSTNRNVAQYIFSLSDNDFVTQDGYLEGGKFAYSDSTGYNLDNQALVFKVRIPALSVAAEYRGD